MKKTNTPPTQRKVSPSLKPKPIRHPAKAARPSLPNRSNCPINLVLEMVGDAWSMLIIRDILLRNHTGYQSFLTSGEKIATNILADRLVKLETHGLLNKTPDPKDARKFIYSLTERGVHLAPILVEMALYSAQFEPHVDMAKDQLAAMQRNKVQFSQNLIKAFSPKIRHNSKPKHTKSERDETLNLF